MATESQTFTLRWGIMATVSTIIFHSMHLTFTFLLPTTPVSSQSKGGIARQFAQDLLTDPSTRGVHDVLHRIVAVASSSSAERAQTFIDEIVRPDATQKDAKVRAYGTYDELVKDPEVDVVYIASPASHHYTNALMCLEAGKNICCEVMPGVDHVTHIAL